MKKDGNEDFDISMGCYDGAKICELVGSFIQKSTRNSNGKNDIGLYWDDVFSNFNGTSKTKIERKKKLIVETFKQCGLATTKNCYCFRHHIWFKNIVYKPYSKANDKPTI